MKKFTLIIATAVIALTGCQTIKDKASFGKSQKADAANPASVFCEKQGGKSVIRANEQGEEVGYCILPNAPTVEEWDYYRKHNASSS